MEDWPFELDGFQVEAIDRDDMAAVKDSLGLPSDLSSCHTGVIDGYVIEGHVPAEQVARLIEEKPEALGLAVQRERDAGRERLRVATADFVQQRCILHHFEHILGVIAGRTVTRQSNTDASLTHF